MSKQSFILIFLVVVLFIMLSIFKNTILGTDTKALKKLVDSGALLVDVRTPQEFAAGNVSTSINVPLSEIQNNLSKFKNHQNIVVFCRSGNRSSQAKTILEQNGFTNVVNGGTWQNVKSATDEARR